MTDDEFHRDLKEVIYGPNEPTDYEDFPEDDGAVAEYEERKRRLERDEREHLPIMLGSVSSDLRTIASSLDKNGDDVNRKEILEISERLDEIASVMGERIRGEEVPPPPVTTQSNPTYGDIPF
ncbi:hypothetical protein [Nodosilinea nodulosa]|uniref:hypothetical protein n=1 Tax=Nodosilinea nodulosa TaxID=416001 RepID=UPI0012D8281B|nr:hypothetical protein [Nodosilinea nodulosa]